MLGAKWDVIAVAAPSALLSQRRAVTTMTSVTQTVAVAVEGRLMPMVPTIMLGAEPGEPADPRTGLIVSGMNAHALRPQRRLFGVI
jgi:hypothetical protein